VLAVIATARLMAALDVSVVTGSSRPKA